VRDYLEAAFEDGDPALIAAALGDVARARAVTEIAHEACVSSEAMHKVFRPKGNPTLETLARVIKGARLQAHRSRGSNQLALVGTPRPCPAQRRVD
jgi:probable addiction module antidote protein